jgi:hypothetical protein
MNDRFWQGLEIVRQSEISMKELIKQAAEGSDYESIPKLNSWALQLKAMSAESSPPSPSGAAIGAVIMARKNEYPKFFRNEGNLIMIGWSKKNGTEYKHEAPSAVISLVASALSSSAINGKLVKFEDLLQLVAKMRPEGTVPIGHVYTCLRWMRSMRIVETYGRRSGYRLAQSPDTLLAIESHWERLGRADG